METLLSRFAAQETLPREVYKIAKYYYARAGRQDKAIELYQYMANTWPEDDYALLSLKEEAIARIKRHQMVEAQEVIEILLTSFSEHKKLAEALNGIAKAYHQVQDDEKALEYYNYVLANYPVNDATLEARKGTAIAYIGLGQDEKVNAAVETLLTDFADYSGLIQAVYIIGEEYYYLAVIMNKQGFEAASKEYYRKAIAVLEMLIWAPLEQDSDLIPDATFAVGRCYERFEEYEIAIEYYKKILEEWPDFRHAGTAGYLLGNCYKEMARAGRMSDAAARPLIIQACHDVIDRYPGKRAVGAALNLLQELEQTRKLNVMDDSNEG